MVTRKQGDRDEVTTRKKGRSGEDPGKIHRSTKGIRKQRNNLEMGICRKKGD